MPFHCNFCKLHGASLLDWVSKEEGSEVSWRAFWRKQAQKVGAKSEQMLSGRCWAGVES